MDRNLLPGWSQGGGGACSQGGGGTNLEEQLMQTRSQC